MKYLIFVLLVIFCSSAFTHQEIDFEVVDNDESVLTPEGEDLYFLDKSIKAFPRTSWRECSDSITGNYTGYRCASRRGISVILNTFIKSHFLRCVNEGLRHFKGIGAVDLHVTHDGIQGDARHSPRSLHAEARAIDVDSFVVTYKNGRSERLVYEQRANRAFYQKFRECWGRTIQKYNGCPSQNPLSHTGSIGWEDRNHQHHMHVSVPYCVSGRYAGNYYRR